MQPTPNTALAPNKLMATPGPAPTALMAADPRLKASTSRPTTESVMAGQNMMLGGPRNGHLPEGSTPQKPKARQSGNPASSNAPNGNFSQGSSKLSERPPPQKPASKEVSKVSTTGNTKATGPTAASLTSADQHSKRKETPRTTTSRPKTPTRNHSPDSLLSEHSDSDWEENEREPLSQRRSRQGVATPTPSWTSSVMPLGSPTPDPDDFEKQKAKNIERIWEMGGAARSTDLRFPGERELGGRGVTP